MNLNLVKLSHYNIPHLVERPNQDWVSFGEDNLYPNYLLELFLGSAINGALIKSIGAMIYGEGLAATNADESEANKESFLRLTELLHNSDDDVLKDLAMDLKLFGGCYVNVIWSRDRSKIAKLLHIPAQYIRSGKMVDGEIDTYYYSADWSKARKSEYRPRAYAAFNTEDRTQASQILMIRDKNPALFYGFAPDYVAATDWIQMELEIAQFHLSNITSGMTPSMHVGFSNGVPTEEERRTIERQLNQKFAGSGNAGKILLTFNDGKDTAPIIEPIQMNDAQSAWEGMSKQAVNQILAGHRCVSPLLFGIRTEGGNGLGSNADELRDAYSLFNNTVVVPFQNILLRGLDKVFRINDINLDLYFKTLKPADFIDLDVVKTQSEDDQEKEGVSNEEIEQEDLKHEFKDLQDIDTKPTKGMVEEAIKGLEWRREHKRGGTQVAVARATNIKNGDNLSFDTIKRMNSFFARHEVDKKAEGFEIGEDGFPSAGRIAWALWGGDAGQSWAKKKVNEIEGVREDLSDDEFDGILANLNGEIVIDDDWEIVDEQDQDQVEDYEEWAKSLIAENKKENMADEIKSKEDAFSYLDKSFYRIRFKYIKKSRKAGGKSRRFCENMMTLARAGFVYRIEDIDKASREGVNRQLGHKGKPYDLFRFKGGVYCRHAFKVILYRLKSKSLLKEPDKKMDDYNKADSIPKTYMPRPRGIKDAQTAPVNMPNQGHYPGVK
jgi:hypothetical protein